MWCKEDGSWEGALVAGLVLVVYFLGGYVRSIICF